MREKIARIVSLDHLQLLHDFDVDPDIYRMDPECHDGALATADAIIAALPDCIPDLVWDRIDPVTEGCKSPIGNLYTIWAIDGVGYCRHPNTAAGERYEGGIEGARSAANAHHRAQIMAAFGVTL